MNTLTCVYMAIFFKAVACSQAIENGRVDDPIFKKLGYECLSSNEKIGPMKAGETKTARGSCDVYQCESEGVILLTSCTPPAHISGLNCKIVDGDKDEAYPECCPIVKC